VRGHGTIIKGCGGGDRGGGPGSEARPRGGREWGRAPAGDYGR
jgi:hypothetical protein